jgi:hypothetical protein
LWWYGRKTDFYHAFYELIEKFCEERGQLQYRIPEKAELQKQYEVRDNSDLFNLLTSVYNSSTEASPFLRELLQMV